MTFFLVEAFKISRFVWKIYFNQFSIFQNISLNRLPGTMEINQGNCFYEDKERLKTWTLLFMIVIVF